MIIVSHSMGGLITKRAFVLSKQTIAYEGIAKRVTAMVFIATPHSGSNLAGILDKLFRMSSGLKPYLEDLGRNSDMVQSVNADFPAHSLGLMLHSFYETKPLSVGGLREVMIVPKADAILNYPHEQSALLYGDHRSVCKFTSLSDPNFISVWQAISSCISKPKEPSIKQTRPPSVASTVSDELSRYLNIWEPPVDDYFRVKSNRLPGSVQWLRDHSEYLSWENDNRTAIYWLRGPPGCGKSYAAGYVIEDMESKHIPCCYYFFTYGDWMKASMEGFLLAMTWQMAAIHPEIQQRILRICARDPGIAKSGDYRTLLRKFWEQGILQSALARRTYWVIDAFDECRQGQELAKFLSRAIAKTGAGMIKIFVTTRNTHTDYNLTESDVLVHDIRTGDIRADIARYLETHTLEAPGSTRTEKEALKDLILARSNGCFLWVTLVLDSLRKIVGTQAQLRTLEELPPGMDHLYSRIVKVMPDKEKQISKTILTWVALAIRPLTTQELKHVIERLAMDEVEDIDTVISKYCHNLLYVDSAGRVKLRHASARGYLLRRDIDSEHGDEMIIDRQNGHRLLALECLEYLNGPEMRPKQRRKMVAVTNKERSAFASYACDAVHEHVNKSSTLETDVLTELATFLKTNVLSWIEELAKRGNLDAILRFAQVLRTFLQRKSRTDLLLGEDAVVVEDWSVDLVKMVSKFGRQLLMHPESIMNLIPPFCPPDTILYTQFGRAASSSLTVLGMAGRFWDDCLCTLAPSRPQQLASGLVRQERLNCLATTEEHVFIGTSLGRVAIFDDKTSLEEMTVDHHQPVLFLQSATSKPLLASASKRHIKLWNTETWEQQWEIPTRKTILNMEFVDDDQMLLAVLQNHTILAINLIDRTSSSTCWLDILEEPHLTWYSTAGTADHAIFNRDLGVLALGYRLRHVLVYNYDQETYQVFDHQDGLYDGSEQVLSLSIYSMAFSNLLESPLLAVSFSCAELVLFDVEQGTIQARLTSVYFSHLSSSPDGRTLAAARRDGAIELYDFETLQRLYRIRAEGGAVVALNFSSDSARFLVVRAGGRHCRIWDPAALYRRDVGDGSLRTPSLGSGSQDGVVEEADESVVAVTAVTCDPDGQSYYVGKEDHTVSVFDARTAAFADSLFSHVASVKGLSVGVKIGLRILVSIDTAGFLMVHKLSKSNSKIWSAELLLNYRASITGVQQYLLSQDLTRLLIVSNDQVCLYSPTDGAELVPPRSCRAEGENIYFWTHHPGDPSLLMYFVNDYIRLYDSKTLQLIQVALTDFDRLGLAVAEYRSEEPCQLSVRGVTPLFTGGKSLFAVYMGAGGVQNSSRAQGRNILCFPASECSRAPTSTTISPLIAWQPVCDAIDVICGVYRERLVFLHNDGWICSIKASGLWGGSTSVGGGVGRSEGIVHHFAPPMDWLRGSTNLLVQVSKLGDVMFVVKGEIAVVKKGLDRAAENVVGVA